MSRAERDAIDARRKAETALTKPLSFRSVSAAVDAARDGDRIVIQLGHHNMGGSVLKLDKRVLIRCATSLRLRRLVADKLLSDGTGVQRRRPTG